ncbi:RNA-splicing ligase RtcB [Sporocytophaga myxococcoides]|uniref:3'-phosphate/5'-hydroxy nucleic acid ligase n=1 Tax=Sporocytophaga myxococcoides TaxID=153721 RepID=A0A098LD57_9BACT|nr:RtcB family protein [Sporocytophaga myxococcoides]GAL84344.1 RNA-splicing ligase RtcB [Sporocytophaga myxococcoides]
MQNKGKINGNQLIEIGYPEGKVIGIALEVIQKEYSLMEPDEVLDIMKNVLASPSDFLNDLKTSFIAEELLKPNKKDEIIELLPSPRLYKIYGKEGIEAGAIKQMDTAMRLPVSIAGALMPDAHQGYGLPIGGVLATRNTVIPYGVGVDIGCRMCMSIFDIPAGYVETGKGDLMKMLVNNTMFGRATFKKPKDHEIISNPLFSEIEILRGLKERAYAQLGSSGGGNHFVEFGIVEVVDSNNEWNIAPGKYLSLLSHSGSRGMGATIANYYTKLAMETCKLPQEAKHLAWLDLDTEAGQEYWLAMNLAGDYASACHHQIHERMAIGLRTNPVAMIENHHNFAWKEKDEKGNDVIVHRKGATPAGKGVLGIIPGSMTAPGYVVRGKGDEASVNSASHGAGRAMSRTQAKNTLKPETVKQQLQKAGVELIGSGLDEAPMAYKDIRTVMEAQKDLVEVVGVFLPKIVRMCGDEKFQEVD